MVDKKVLIIGSQGFIGKHLKSYLSNDFTLLCVDVIDCSDSGYIRVDINNPNYNQIFENFLPDFCINCSGAANVPLSFSDTLNDFSLNTYNVVKLLDAIRMYCKDCRFINMSSAAVYGNPKSIPISETFVTNPISPYGIHKLMAESVMEEYHNFFNLNTCTLRIFSAYGIGLKKQIMYDLYNKFTIEDKICLFGTGNETRDYIHIDDICNAIHLVMKNSNFDNDVVNIANGEEIKLNYIVNIFRNIFESKKDIVFSGEVREGDPSRWKADISKLKSWGYKQTVNLENGIKEYVEWIKNV